MGGDGGKHLDFERVHARGKHKTEVWAVWSEHSGVQLGVIKWRSGWRKYAFWPFPDTLFDSDCLNRISAFAEKLNAEQRAWRIQQKEANAACTD